MRPLYRVPTDGFRGTTREDQTHVSDRHVPGTTVVISCNDRKEGSYCSGITTDISTTITETPITTEN